MKRSFIASITGWNGENDNWLYEDILKQKCKLKEKNKKYRTRNKE
jgi:hypothetical protein